MVNHPLASPLVPVPTERVTLTSDRRKYLRKPLDLETEIHQLLSEDQLPVEDEDPLLLCGNKVFIFDIVEVIRRDRS